MGTPVPSSALNVIFWNGGAGNTLLTLMLACDKIYNMAEISKPLEGVSYTTLSGLLVRQLELIMLGMNIAKSSYTRWNCDLNEQMPDRPKRAPIRLTENK